jgi:hypothetical protein
MRKSFSDIVLGQRYRTRLASDHGSRRIERSAVYP